MIFRVIIITLGARDFSSADSGSVNRVKSFSLRPKICRPSANTKNSHRTREKPLVPRVSNYRLLVKTMEKKSQNHLFGQPDGFSILTGTKCVVRLIELPFTLQHDREFMSRFYFPLFIKQSMVLLCVVFKNEWYLRAAFLSISACYVYVRLETTDAAIEIARGTTNNQ